MNSPRKPRNATDIPLFHSANVCTFKQLALFTSDSHNIYNYKNIY